MIKTDILLVTSVHPPFDTRVYHKIFCSLKNNNLKVKILLPNRLDLASKNTDFISFKGSNSFLHRVCNFVKILRICLKIKPAIIIFFDPDLLPIMILLKVITKTKVIYDNHEDYPSYLMVKKSIPIWIRRLVKVSYKFFFKISESVFDFIFYADPFTSGFDPAKQKQAIIYNYPIVSKYPQKEKKYDLIFPGSVDLDVCQRLMKIAEEFDKKYSHKIKFLIIGRDVSSENKHLIQSITLKLQNVELIFMEDMPFKSVQEYIAESKIGLLPLPNIEKFRKNIPTKLFEYMLHSIPMLASDLPPISCFLEKTDGNFVITENDYQNSYIEKISEILDHYPEYRKKCNLNFQILEQQWNWDRTEKQKLVKIINKMLM